MHQLFAFPPLGEQLRSKSNSTHAAPDQFSLTKIISKNTLIRSTFDGDSTARYSETSTRTPQGNLTTPQSDSTNSHDRNDHARK